LNQGGKAKTEDLVLHLRDKDFTFEDFKTLKTYTEYFRMEGAVMHLVQKHTKEAES